MKLDTLSKYIGLDFLVTFGLTVLIFTFVMCVGGMIKAIDLLARGVAADIIFRVFLNNIPFILTFSIPMSALTAALLNFTRMSLDGEVTAMRSSGLSMWQIICAPVIVSVLLSCLCLYLNCLAAPNSHFARRKLLREVGMEEPANLLEEGRFVRDFPGMMIYVGKKDESEVRDVVVYEVDERGVKRNVRAQRGVFRPREGENILYIDLYDVRIDQPDPKFPLDLSRARYITAERYPVKLDFSQVWGGKEASKKAADMTMGELMRAVRDVAAAYPDLDADDLLRQKMATLVEANQRLALSIACFAFVLLGIPLGLRSKRRESSVGVGISLMLVFVFYLFIVIADALTPRPEWHPDLIVWIPVIGAQLAGFILIEKAN